MWRTPRRHRQLLDKIDRYNRTMHALKAGLDERVAKGEMREDEATEVAGMLREQEYRQLTLDLEQ